MKTVERHKKTDFGDVWYVNAIDGTYRFAVYKYDDDPNTIYLSNVFVKEESRKQGYGNEILKAAEDYAKKFDATAICLKVLSGSDVHRWYKRHGYEDLEKDEEERGYMWMRKMMKEVNESIWSDMQDRGNGDLKKKEDEIPEQFKKVLAIYIHTFAHLEAAVGNYTVGSCSEFIAFIKDYQNKPAISQLDPDIPELVQYVRDNWDFVCDIIMKTITKVDNEVSVVVDNIIDDMKKDMNESIWSDMQERGTGDLVKKEDDVNMMDVNKFFEYLIAKYWRPEQKVNSLDKDHYSKDFETDIVVDPKHGTTIFGSYNDGELRQLMVVSNKLFLHIGAKSPKNLVWTPSKPGESLNKRYYITEKNREISNKTFIDVIEFFLHNEIKESIWSDMQARGVKDVEKKEDKMSRQDLECLDQYIMNFANEVVYGQGRGEEAGNLDEFCDYIRKDNEVKDANKDRILKYVKEVWFDELCDDVSGAIEQTQKEYHQDLYESVWTDMQDRGTGEIKKSEDNINNLDFEGFYYYLLSRYEFGDKSFGITKFEDDNPTNINISLLDDRDESRVYRTNIFDLDNDPYITVPDIKGFTKRPLFKKLSDNFNLEHLDDSFSPKFKVLPKDGGDVDKKFLIQVIDFIIDNAESPLVPTIKRRVNESVWSDMQDRGTGNQLKKEDDKLDDRENTILRQTSKMFKYAVRTSKNDDEGYQYSDTKEDFIFYIQQRKGEMFWTGVKEDTYDKLLDYVERKWDDNCKGIDDFSSVYIYECEGVPGGLTPADVGGMGAAYFPGPNGEPGSGDLPMPTGHVYQQVAPFAAFIKERKKKGKKKKKFRKEDEPCVHSPNAKVYDYVDDYREYVDRTYDMVNKRK